MRREHQDARALHHLHEFSARLGHERSIDGADTLIEQQNLWLNGGHHAEREANAHTRRIRPQRHRQVFPKLGEFRDFIHFPPHRLARLPQK